MDAKSDDSELSVCLRFPPYGEGRRSILIGILWIKNPLTSRHMVNFECSSAKNRSSKNIVTCLQAGLANVSARYTCLP